MRLREQPRRSAGENIIPLINIVFLLLVFFLLAGTLAPRPPFELKPVQTTESPPADIPESMLYIAASGQLFYQGRALSPADLAGTASGGRDPKAPFEILLDRRLKAEALFPVVEALARAGITNIRLLTERREG